jgi:hypothetical protein
MRYAMDCRHNHESMRPPSYVQVSEAGRYFVTMNATVEVGVVQSRRHVINWAGDNWAATLSRELAR